MKIISTALAIPLLGLFLSACGSANAPGVEAEAKSDKLACVNMNMDFFTSLLETSNLDLPSERLQLFIDELNKAEEKAENPLLKNIMSDSASGISTMLIAVDEPGNEFFLRIALNNLQDTIDACESVR